MVADSVQSMSVSWSPYGKILTNTKAGGASLAFGYNAMQQRVVKRVAQSGDTTRTYYIRDAQGNTMGVYTRHNDSVTWREQYIFGSSRLGLYRADTLVNKGLTQISKLYEGKRNYELTNHLGNVMVVINDRKTDTLISSVRYYNAVVISAMDYYPFGMGIDSRTYTATTYRYGFNGKENDKETGEQDYGMRIYDPRIAKFLSVDPIGVKYPELTPYQFASNRPIQGIDLDGKEFFDMTGKQLGPITWDRVSYLNNKGYSLKIGNKVYIGLNAQAQGLAIHSINYEVRDETFQEPGVGDKIVSIYKYTVEYNNSNTNQFLSFTTDLDSETDGINNDKKDKTSIYQTTFSTRNPDNSERFLDGTSDPFIAIPNLLRNTRYGANWGDFASIKHNGHRAYGIVGDRSDKDHEIKIGEASVGMINLIRQYLTANYQDNENTTFEILLNSNTTYGTRNWPFPLNQNMTTNFGNLYNAVYESKRTSNNGSIPDWRTQTPSTPLDGSLDGFRH